MTLHVSDDLGNTWPQSQVVFPGAAGYSSLARTASGLAILYERNTSQHDCVGKSCVVVFAELTGLKTDDTPQFQTGDQLNNGVARREDER
eukprot:COSAG05_NODE_285_length_12188_cov_539.399537_11_plen_90_part_00